ncbi:hypothetical protein A1O1_00221 [Capronia coronata CBS 617.96]|uniref:TEA domain-containing protein n=1 Tax=Capronia coronata CBS 617.96 TaxID=1182541 RepID=W9YQ95_9EURO|nr:uncharacterized protein A1O1_00221 [Capronia coronata CBS 617.96]EXJ95102.1 hypothetical protein A1O1_00221 [Capronia coronata CBS 617.96]
MDLLHSVSPAATQSEDGSNTQPGFDPLSTSSGNARSFGGVSYEGIENQRPLPELSAGLSMTQEVHFPSPLIKLGSNDTSALVFDRKPRRNLHRPHRSKPLTNADRPYLTHPKYLEYRSRPRQDIGPDGKPIWPDRIEAAFQNALVHIKPMGRKKCSQRGRPYGRNMLIAEWIYRETGEVRVRKQVSSHIQVLDRFLKGIPEWDRLIKPGDDEDTSPTEGHKFYHNSIEHMVNEQKAMKGGMHLQEDFEADGSEDRDTSLQVASSDIINLQRLTFEMWVSQPDDWEHALHHYTRLQSLRLEPIPLQDVVGWQVFFPHLPSIVDDWSNGNQCDLILLDASFQLMEDFPPRHSKLGIGLELDFIDEDWPTTSRLDDWKEWTCVTRIYRDGHEVTDSCHEECRASGRGKIKPFFQSRWWASTFTSLTEAERLAEDSKDLTAIELANQQSSNFLRSLTIMQELSAIDMRPGKYGEKHGRKSRQRKAVLLWRFSQAPLGTGGTTTWRSVWVPPSEDLSTNSTLHSVERGLPPLSMHAMDDCSPNIGSFDNSGQFLSQNSLPYNMYLGSMDEELCQDGFMSFKPVQIPDLGHLASSFPLPSTQAFLPRCDMGPLDVHVDASQQHLQTIIGEHSIESANIFELPELKKHLSNQSDPSYTKYSLHETIQGSTDMHEHPLARFNIQTHQVLQEQLGSEEDAATQPLSGIKPEAHSPQLDKTDEHGWTGFLEGNHGLEVSAAPAPQQTKPQAHSWVPVDEQDEALRSALLAACAMSDLGAQSQGSPLRRRVQGISKLHPHDEPRWAASQSIFRPMLHSHHSFPGLRSMQDVNGDACGLPFDDHDGAHGLALLQCQLRQNGDNQLSVPMEPDELHPGSDGFGGGSGGGTRGLPRAQSEPDHGPMRMPVPNLHSATAGLAELDHGYPKRDSVAEIEEIPKSPHQAHSQPLPLEDTDMGDSFGEVTMDDIRQ